MARSRFWEQVWPPDWNTHAPYPPHTVTAQSTFLFTVSPTLNEPPTVEIGSEHSATHPVKPTRVYCVGPSHVDLQVDSHVFDLHQVSAAFTQLRHALGY